MKVRNANLKLRALSLAMFGVVSSMYAYADDDEAAALMNPTSSVTVEEIYVSQGSQKFGEYNGLNKQGGYVNGNINIRGGDAYKDNQNGGTDRWSIQGNNLGLSNRDASIGYSDQGNWAVGVGYDQLQHNLAPGYQTPYQGSMGGNIFVLPSTFSTAASTTALNATQKAAYTQPDISSTRQNSSFSASKIIDSSMSLNVDFNHLDQSGAKLMGFASSGSVGNAKGEMISILPNPTNYQTDTVSVALNWQNEKARLTGSYFGSFFRDANNGVSWMTFGNANAMQTMSTAPSNQLQQLNLSGGYDFSTKTKLAANLSYGRNTQTSSTLFDSAQIVSGAVVPQFNGLVNTAHADVKLTDASFNDLKLAASYKFDQRNNLTPSSITGFYPINTGPVGVYVPTTPLSYTNSQFELGGNYKISKNQSANLAYTNVSTQRYCNQYGVGTNPTGLNGTSYVYPAGANCVTATSSQSNKVDAFYKLKASETVDMKLAYGLDMRKTNWDQNAITAMDVSATYGLNVNNFQNYPGLNMLPGQNGGDYVGFRPFFDASRNQQTVKGRINWQAIDELSFGLNGKYSYATYPDSTYGVQNSTQWNLGLDATFNYTEDASLIAYAVQQNSQRNLSNNYYYKYSAANPAIGSSTASDGSGTWNNNLQNHDSTIGLGLRHGGLMSGKLTLNGDLTYSLGQTFYNTTPGSFVAGFNGVGGSSFSNAVGTWGGPPGVRNDLIAIKFGGVYKVDKNSKIGLQYLYQRLVSNDYYYNGLQYGYTPTSVMATNQTSGSYNVNVFTVGYTYSFD
jgi:MtrB/PioB family decaheme-associated outer membrane protein